MIKIIGKDGVEIKKIIKYIPTYSKIKIIYGINKDTL